MYILCDTYILYMYFLFNTFKFKFYNTLKNWDISVIINWMNHYNVVAKILSPRVF